MNKKALFGANLKNERMRRGYSYADLSRLTGMPIKRWYIYETGRSFPKPENLSKILSLFGVDMDYMLQDRSNNIDIGPKEKEIFVKNLKNERIKKGYTQGELCKRAGLCRIALSKYETGVAFPRIGTISKLLNALDVDIDYMLTAHKEDLFAERDRIIEIFARNLKQERIKKGYSQGELCKRTGISNTMMSAYETGQLLPTPEKLKVLAETLELDLRYMFENEACDSIGSTYVGKTTGDGKTRPITKKDREAFAQNLKLERLKKGYLQKELSEKTGIKKRTISYYEAGRFFPCDDKMHRLLEALEVDLGYMLEERPYELSQKGMRKITIDGTSRYVSKKERGIIASNLREEMLKKGYSTKELSEKTGVAISKIHKYKAGELFPSDEILSKLLKALEVDFDYMLRGQPGNEAIDPIKEAFALNLKNERLSRGYSRQDLAEKIGVSKSTIDGYELGRFFPGASHMAKILNVLDVTLDYMLRQ